MLIPNVLKQVRKEGFLLKTESVYDSNSSFVTWWSTNTVSLFTCNSGLWSTVQGMQSISYTWQNLKQLL